MVQPLENSMTVLQKVMNVELPCHRATLFLRLHPEELKAVSQRAMCTPTLTAALRTGAKRERNTSVQRCIPVTAGQVL